MSRPEVPKAPGHQLSAFSAKLAAWIISLIIGLGLAVAALGCVALDLALGPQFIDSYTNANGHPLTGLERFVPYAVSLAMTGLQYALFDRIAVAIEDESARSRKAKILIAVAAVVAIADTLMDIGGATSWRYPDNEAANIIPSNPDVAWWIQSPCVGLVCLLHEPILQSVLARFKNRLADRSYTGSVLIGSGVRAGAWILNIVKTITLPAGAVSMVVIDLILLPELGTTTAAAILLWCLSIGLTGFQYMLWEHHENVGLKLTRRLDTTYVYIGWLIGVLDTIADWIGYTTAIYGDGTGIVVIPDKPTWTWGLGSLVVAIVCFAGERLFKEMLWRPGDGRGRKSVDVDVVDVVDDDDEPRKRRRPDKSDDDESFGWI